jgi:N-acetylneuraminic acid mutarotase
MKNLLNQRLTLKHLVLLFSFQFLLLTYHCFPQVGINNSGNLPNKSAMLDASSVNQGILINRMTTVQRDAITSPATSLMIFNTTTNCFEAYVNGAWNIVSCPTPCASPLPPSNINATNIQCNSFTANWSPSNSATTYFLDVSTTNSFSTFITGFRNLNVGNSTTYNITGLTFGTTYYYQLRSSFGNCTGVSSNPVSSATTLSSPPAPTAGTITPSPSQIVWIWGIVSNATGYKWSTANNYTNATNIGATTSYTQTSLNCNTPYTLYIWAYNTCTNSPPLTMTSATTSNPGTASQGNCTSTKTSITWNWIAVNGATGYKYSTLSSSDTNPVDIGNTTTYLQTGLTCNTPYSLYVWARNGCGNSTVATLIQTTSACTSPSNIYVIGGYGAGNLSTNEAYDPVSDSWIAKASMPTARQSPAAAVVNNIIYVIGGAISTEITTNEAYDPVANSWTTKASMPTARNDFSAAAVNNIIYAIGGYTDVTHWYLNTNEAYNPVTNSWVTKAPMPVQSLWMATQVVNNIIYVIGGGNNPVYNTNYAYNPATDSWSSKAPLPTPRSLAASAVVNNIIYVIGGFAWSGMNEIFVTANEAYNPATDTWTTKTSMTSARINCTASPVNNIIYVIGGFNGSILSINEAYDPVANSWSTKTSMPTARYTQVSAVIP